MKKILTKMPVTVVMGILLFIIMGNVGFISAEETLCPSVCVPMWEIDNGECVYNDCGSGCGSNGETTFDTEEECLDAVSNENKETEVTLEELDVSAGITPDSPIYFIDLAIDNIRLHFSKDTSFGLMVAEERLAETMQMYKQNKTEEAKEAEQQRERVMNQVRERVQTQEQQTNLEDALNKHLKILNQIRENVSEQAYEGIGKAIESSQTGLRKAKELNIGMANGNGQQ